MQHFISRVSVYLIVAAALLPNFGYAKPNCAEYLKFPTPSTRENLSEWLQRNAPESGSYEEPDTLAREILGKDSAHQSLWVQAVVDAYLPVARGRFGPPPAHALIGGKRFLDRMLLWLQNTSDRYEELQTQQGPKEAFRSILSQQYQLFNSPCTPSDIFTVIDKITASVKQWENGHPNAAPLSVIVGGSFINGKIRKGSDIDVTVSDASVSRDLIPELDASLNTGVSPECDPKFSGHSESEMFYGQLNAFALKIHSKYTELYVFQPAFAYTDGFRPPTGKFKKYEWNNP